MAKEFEASAQARLVSGLAIFAYRAPPVFTFGDRIDKASPIYAPDAPII
jgi:hypothetical protein